MPWETLDPVDICKNYSGVRSYSLTLMIKLVIAKSEQCVNSA